MIYLFYGDDTNKTRISAHNMLDELLIKHPDANLIRIESDNWDKEKINEYALTKDLFGNKIFIFLDNVAEDDVFGAEMLDLVGLMENSYNEFVILDSYISTKNIKEISKRALISKIFTSEKTKSPKDNFNVFSLTDALGERNHKKLWLLFQKGILLGVTAEEMLGLLFWQVKNIHIVKKINSATRANMKPLVFQKATIYTRNYTEDETRKLLFKIIDIYHRARRGHYDLKDAVERLTLSI